MKETGRFGNIFGCGMNIGTHYFYDENGYLIKTILYENWFPDEVDGCHSTIQETYISEYAKYQTLKWRKRYQSVYEGDEHKAGIWEEFDEHGNLISSHDYGMKYTRK